MTCLLKAMRGLWSGKVLENYPMVTCGHQFFNGDQCDWLISSSAVCPVTGNMSATEILKRLIENHCGGPRDMVEDCREWSNEGYEKSGRLKEDAFRNESGNKMSELYVEAKEINLEVPAGRRMKRDPGNGCETKYYEYEEFDEGMHSAGCPVKWHYQKRMKNAKRIGNDNFRSEAPKTGAGFRDRVPLEVKIGKISLAKKEPIRNFTECHVHKDTESVNGFQIDPKVMESRKKKLAAKLNWKSFQENDNEGDFELSCNQSCKDGYLRPRSILGGKAPVSILLFPYNHLSCCALTGATQKEEEQPGRKATSVSVKALYSPESKTPKIMDRPKTAQSLRWGSKTPRLYKRLQLPTQTNVSFDVTLKPPKHYIGRRETKKLRNRAKKERMLKSSQSLSSLCYDLENKSNGGQIIDEEYLEQMICQLSVSDNGVRNFFNPELCLRKTPGKGRNSRNTRHLTCERWSDDEHFKIICNKAKFSERPYKSPAVDKRLSLTS